MCVPNNRASNYMWQKLMDLQGEIDKFTIIVGDFNTTLSEMDIPSRQKISKDIAEHNITIKQLDRINIYRLLHPTTGNYTFFSSWHGIFAKIDHILGHKTHSNKLKGTEIRQCLLSDHNGIKVEINDRKITGKSPNMWRISNTLLNNT